MKVGTIFGIPVRLHWSFSLLFVGSVLGALATGGMQTAMQNTLFLGGLFLCVLFHEFGHALMARRFEVATEHVTLYPFGGIAALRGLPKNPAAEFLDSPCRSGGKYGVCRSRCDGVVGNLLDPRVSVYGDQFGHGCIQPDPSLPDGRRSGPSRFVGTRIRVGESESVCHRSRTHFCIDICLHRRLVCVGEPRPCRRISAVRHLCGGAAFASTQSACPRGA